MALVHTHNLVPMVALFNERKGIWTSEFFKQSL